MVLEKVISQLEDLVSDRRSFIVGDGEGEYDDVFQLENNLGIEESALKEWR